MKLMWSEAIAVGGFVSSYFIQSQDGRVGVFWVFLAAYSGIRALERIAGVTPD
jgi:hypothetical protein